MKPKSLIGNRYTRLVVTADSGQRAGDGSVKWMCLCDCGAEHLAVAANLKAGSVGSCGCLAKEQSADRAKLLFTKPKQNCMFDGCTDNTSKGGNGYCGKHAQRVRRYGDAGYVTPSEIASLHNREAQLAIATSLKPTTYKKYLGKHEHRVVAANAIGRELLPGEHVHHIDGDKHNNNSDNLMVMTAAEHLRLHALERKNAA